MTALLIPRLWATANVVRRHPLRTAVLAVLVAAFWGVTLVVCVKVLSYFQTIGEFGPLLTQRLLVLVFVTFLGVLVMSNTVTALTTFYLAADVPVLLAAPVSFRRLHNARFVETAVSSSWMVLLFGLPILLSYGIVYTAGPLYYLATAPVLLAFVAIPAGLGVLVTTALVMVFPAQRTYNALLVGVGLLVGGIVLAVRMMGPEQLAHPSGLAGFAGFLAGLGATGSPYLPSTWAAEALVPLLGARSGEPLFHLGMLVSTAAMLFAVSAAVVEQVFLHAWSRAQLGRVRAAEGRRWLTRVLGWGARPLPRVPGLLLVKDVTVFLRDASQWSQLLLLGALVGIYLYNFSVLPVHDGTALATAMRDLATVLNLGLGAFVTTAVAVRFVYPMVSLEGRAWWILRSAPVALARLWWAKFWIGFVPLLAFALVLTTTTNRQLGVPPALMWLFATTLVPLVAALVSLGLAFGASYPKLDTQNAAQIATGFGAVVYMVTALGLIAVVVSLEAWPAFRLLRLVRDGLPMRTHEWMLAVAAVLAAFAVAMGTVELARRRGVSALGRLPL